MVDIPSPLADDDDPLPDPETLTLGGALLVCRELEGPDANPITPHNRRAINRRRVVLARAKGMPDVEKYLTTRGKAVNVEGLLWLRQELASALGKSWREVERLTLGEAMAAAPPATPAENDGVRSEGAEGDGRFTPTAWKFLRALRELEACTNETCVSQATVCEQAKVGNPDSKGIREATRALKSAGYIDSRQSLGTWITAAGIAALESRD